MAGEPTRLEFGQREPLTTRLHGLVRSYPRGVGILHEFIQNADDAGATELWFVLDERNHPKAPLPCNEMVALQGPAIVVYNNASFSEDDWGRIQDIGQSGKSLDTSKTGRFGLGFNSVYNVTDWPCIVARQKIGIFDPHGNVVHGASRSNPGSAWQLKEARDKWPAFLAPFEFLQHRTHTVFRLPLRTDIQAARSEISSQSFTSEDFLRIVQKAREEAGELLLFQKNLLSIRVSLIAKDDVVRDLLIVRTLNDEKVREARKRVFGALLANPQETLESLQKNASSVISKFDHIVEVVAEGRQQETQTWLVVNGLFVDPNYALINAAKRMIDIGEKAVPLAGAAALVNRPAQAPFGGRLFCGLPLSSVPSELACHIQGFFDLQSDRQGIFADSGAIGNDATRVEWNRFLLEHACAKAAAVLFAELAQLDLRHSSEPYSRWPVISENAKALINYLPAQIYAALADLECIAAGQPRVWLKPSAVRNVAASAKKVRDPLLRDGLPIPDPMLPPKVVFGFEDAGFALAELTTQWLRDYLRSDNDPACRPQDAPKKCLTDKAWIMDLLTFCVSDKKFDDLRGVPLALMQDGTLRAFGLFADGPILLGCPKLRHLCVSKNSWFISKDIEDLQILEATNKAGIEQLSPQGLIRRLSRILAPIDQNKGVEWNPSMDGLPTHEWLTALYEYLAENKENCSLEHQNLKSLPLIPDQFNRLWGMGHPKTPLLLPSTSTSSELIQSLKAFHVPVVSANDKLTKRIRQLEKAFPDQAIWQLTARDLIDTLVAVEGDWDESTGTFSAVVHTPLLDFFASKASQKDLNERGKDRIEDLRQLPIFPLKSGVLTSLDREDVFVAADVEIPQLQIELGILDSGKEGSWRSLYDQLGVQRLSRHRLIKSVMVPKYSSLTKDDQLTILKWMRTHLQPALDELEKEPDEARESFRDLLRMSKLIHCSDGELRAPDDVYPPDARFVQDLLGELAGFPDLSIYCVEPKRWLEFFRELGAPQSLSARALLRGIDRVIQGALPNSDVSKAALKGIAQYIENHWQDLRDVSLEGDRLKNKQPWTFLDALEARAWLPALQVPSGSYPPALFKTPSQHLFKPSELFVREAVELVGTTSPVCAIPGLVSLRDDLGIIQYPDLELVLDHFERVLEFFQASECTSEDRKATHRVIEKIYHFLGRRFGSNETASAEEIQNAETIRSWSADRPCILDANDKLWKPSDVFREATSYFLGLRGQAQSKHDDVDHGLEVLGRRERPEASDFRAFFDELSRNLEGRPADEEQLDKIREAYNLASNLDDSILVLRGAQVLTDALELAEHTEVVLDDAPWWSARAKRAGICFLDHKLHAAVADTFGVASLSKAVSEEIVEESKTTCQEFADKCSVLQQRIRSDEFRCGLLRILRPHCLTASEKGLVWLKDATIRPVARLITTLCWVDEAEEIPGSEGESDVLIHPTENALVVSTEASDILYQRVAAVIQQELAKQDIRLSDLAPLVSILGEEPGGIDTLLDRLRVPKLPETELVAVPSDAEGEQFIDTEDISEELQEGAGNTAGREAGIGQKLEQTSDLPKADPSTHAVDDDSSEGKCQPGQSRNDAVAQERVTSVPDSSNENAGKDQEPVRVGRSAAFGVEDHQLSGAAATSNVPSTSEGVAKRDAESNPPTQLEETGAAPRSYAGGLKERTGKGQDRPGIGKGPPTSNKSRSAAGTTKGKRARTYVEHHKDEKEKSRSKNDTSKRTDVERAAVERVLAYERQQGRLAKEMSHTNPGYDIESRPPRGEIERYIEVKGLAGAWSDWGVGLSPEQIRHGQREGMRFWLYVVEFALEPARSKIFAIQDPYSLIDEFRFDDGWKQLGKERDGPGAGVLPKVGAKIVIGGNEEGIIRAVRKRGQLLHLSIKFGEDAPPFICVYNPANMRIVADGEQA